MSSADYDRIPHRRLPLLYYGTAHVALGLACLMVGLAPRAVAGFFYHSWMVAIVHLVTLGWITSSILGSVYLVLPLAFGRPMPVRWTDYSAFAVVVIGIVGMVSHFWIEEYGGMAYSAATVTVGVLVVVLRVAVQVTRSHVPQAVVWHVRFACLNLALAASAGVLLGFDKTFHFLPGFVLTNVFAHAHLAALGWATMMVVGIGYRLLPMVLPAQPPTGRTLIVSALFLEAGTLGLAAALFARSSSAVLFGAMVLSGLGSFLAHVAQMVHHPARRPPEAPRIDFAVLHAAAAGLSLVVAAALGTVLLIQPLSPVMLRTALAYGTFGLVGFLAQMVVAMQVRLVPLLAWYGHYAESGFDSIPPSPWTTRDRLLQGIVFVAWVIGVPAIALGLSYERIPLLAVGAWMLFVGVAVGAVDNASVLWKNRRTPASQVGADLATPN
jgi:hypothetical protein